MMQVEVAYGKPDEQTLLTVVLSAGSSARDAIMACGLLQRYPELVSESLDIGVFGRKVPPEFLISDGDRIEVYRPLVIDPKQARRNRSGSRSDHSRRNKT